MSTKHVVIDQEGEVHTRTSKDRVYSHALIVYYPATGPDKYGRSWPASRRVEWASRRELAEKAASTYRNKGLKVEVLVANHM